MGIFNLGTLDIGGNTVCAPPIRGDETYPSPPLPSRCSYQTRMLWRLIKLFCEDRNASDYDTTGSGGFGFGSGLGSESASGGFDTSDLNCNSLMYKANFYGTDFSQEDLDTTNATWNNVIATDPVYTAFGGDVDRIVAESNIIGISITQAAFSSTSALQFPAGLIVNSTHPTIHTRIQRDLGDTGSSLESINCNVILLRTPNVRFEQVEFDNTGCQEDALDIAQSHGTSGSLLALAFRYFKGWNFAAVRLTKSLPDSDPTNISFVSVKFTSAENFRRSFPGRPLISADNAARQTEWVDIDGLYISDANDTFDYIVNVTKGDEVNLMPLDMIMWHYKGDVTFGFFSEYWEVVSYGPSASSNTSGAFYTAAANEIVSSGNCKVQTP